MANITITGTQNYSTLGAAQGDTLTVNPKSELIIDSSTVDLQYISGQYPLSNITMTNASTATPIFVFIGSGGGTAFIRCEANSVLDMDGDKIVLGTGNGSAGQTFNLPQDAGSNNCPHLAGLYIDAGETLRSLESVPKLALNVDATAYANASNHETIGCVFTQDQTANTVTFKQAIPSGQEVYMGNIVIAKGASSTRSDTPYTDTQNGGNLRVRYAHWSEFKLLPNDANSVDVDHLTVMQRVNTQLTRGSRPYAFKNLVINHRLAATNSCNALYARSISLEIRNAWLDANNTVSRNGLDVTLEDSYLERVIVTNYPSSSNTTRIAFLNNPSFRSKFYDCTAGWPGGVVSSRGSDNHFDGMTFDLGCRTDTFDLTGSGNVVVQYDGARNRFSNFTQVDPSTSNCRAWINAHPFNLQFGADFFVGEDFTLYSGATGNQRYNSVVSNQAKKGLFQRITVHGQIRNRLIQNNDGATDPTYKNIYLVDPQTTQGSTIQPIYGMFCQQVSNGSSNATSAHSGPQGSGFDCRSMLQYANGDTNKTTGNLWLFLADCPDIPDYLEEITVTEPFVFTGNNALYMFGLNNEIALTTDTYENVVGCTGLYLSVGGGTSSWQQRVAVRRPGQAWSSYVSWDAAAINTAIGALPSDGADRVQFKFAIKSLTNNDTHYVTRIGLQVTLSGAVAPSSDPDWDPDSPWDQLVVNHTTPDTFGAFVQSLGGTDNAAIAAAVWAAATSANNDSGSFGRMTQQTHLSATRAGSLYQEEEE